MKALSEEIWKNRKWKIISNVLGFKLFLSLSCYATVAVVIGLCFLVKYLWGADWASITLVILAIPLAMLMFIGLVPWMDDTSAEEFKRDYIEDQISKNPEKYEKEKFPSPPKNNDLETLDKREWICPQCGATGFTKATFNTVPKMGQYFKCDHCNFAYPYKTRYYTDTIKLYNVVPTCCRGGDYVSEYDYKEGECPILGGF